MPGEKFSLSTSLLFFWFRQCFRSVLKYVLAVVRISSSLYFSAGWSFRTCLSVHWMREFINLLLGDPVPHPRQHSKMLDLLKNSLPVTNLGCKVHQDHLEQVACTCAVGRYDQLNAWPSPYIVPPHKDAETLPEPMPKSHKQSGWLGLQTEMHRKWLDFWNAWLILQRRGYSWGTAHCRRGSWNVGEASKNRAVVFERSRSCCNEFRRDDCMVILVDREDGLHWLDRGNSCRDRKWVV